MTNVISHRSLAVLLLAGVAGQALHWLITPAAHPSASQARTVAVLAQAVVATATAIWVGRRP